MAAANLRTWGILAALGVTLYLAFGQPEHEGEDIASVSVPVRHAVPPAAPEPLSGAAAPVASTLPARAWKEEAQGNPFRTIEWYVAPKVRAEPPPPPMAPPLPYAYFGKMAEGQQLLAFLQKSDKVVVAKVGDVLDATYRVDSITPEAVGLTYLPLNQHQSAAFGASPMTAPKTLQDGEEMGSSSEAAEAAPVQAPIRPGPAGVPSGANLQELLKAGAARAGR